MEDILKCRNIHYSIPITFMVIVILIADSLQFLLNVRSRNSLSK